MDLVFKKGLASFAKKIEKVLCVIGKNILGVGCYENEDELTKSKN